MKKLYKSIFLLLVVLLTTQLIAQKKPYYNTQEEVIEAAYIAVENSLKLDGYLHDKKLEYNWKGTYMFNITLRGKGEVATVSVAESGDNIKTQNQIKNVLKTMKFPFKMPKDHSYKFKYEFKF
ncbi:MAG: hypothetical protein JKY48_17660 [Flavobacteriales bacterium]|nr:hypothetical protein [Flavobacteriales bacterium]